MRLLLTCTVLLSTFASAVLAQPLPVYEGEGLTIRVLSMNADETVVNGELVFQGSTYPFTGQVDERNGMEYVKGSFKAGTSNYDFTAQRKAGDTNLTFATGGKQYQLREKGAADAGQPVVHKPDGAASTLGSVKFNTVEFRDINMNNVVAYDMLVPEGFTATGHIEWSQEKTPYPQLKIKVEAPDQSAIRFQPKAVFSYWEWTELARAEMANSPFGQMADRQGEPPPADLGQWIVNLVAKNPAQTDVRLISDQRDQVAEQEMIDQERQNPNPNATAPMQHEVHRMQYSYRLNGVQMIEELHVTYTRLPVMATRNMNSYMWLLFFNSQVRAPADKWQQMRPVLYASSQSLRTVPKWFTQSQYLIMAITQRNFEIGIKDIMDRAAHYDKLREEDMAAWRKKQDIGDKQQDARINMIYEQSNFAGPDGTVRKLPNGFKHYYSDGKGGFQMSNSNEPPKEGNWTPVEPMKG